MEETEAKTAEAAAQAGLWWMKGWSGREGRPRVLIVDDDKLLAAAVGDALESYEVEAVVCSTAEEAMARLQAEPIDLLLLDLVLPGLDGREFCELLKADRRWAALPVIMVTVLEKLADRVRGLELGASDYITKPFDLQEVVARVRAVLRTEHMRRDLVAEGLQRAAAEERLAERTRLLEGLRVIGLELAQEVDLDGRLRLAVRSALQLTHAAGGGVWIWDKAKRVLSPRVWQGEVREFQAPLGGLTAAKVMALSGADVAAVHERLARMVDLAEPLACRGRLVGLLGIVWSAAPAAEELAKAREVLTLLAAQVAVAMDNAWLYRAQVRRSKQLGALLEATRAVMSGGSVEDVLQRILRAAWKLSGCEYVNVSLLDESRQGLQVRAERGTLRHLLGEVIPVKGSLSGAVVESGEVVLSPDISMDPRNLWRGGTHGVGPYTFLGVPITVRGAALGVLAFMSRGRRYASEDVGVLKGLADCAGEMIHKVGLHEELEQAYEAQRRVQDELIRREKLGALGELAAGVAHHLNNALGIVVLEAEGMQDLGADRRVRAGLERILLAARDGAEVVGRIENFARQRPAGEGLVRCRIADLVREALELTRPRWREEPARLGRPIVTQVRLGVLPPVRGVEAQIREALVNLIRNALDAMPEGGSLEFIGQVDPKDPNWVELGVRDTGVGMPEAVRQRMFDPFFSTKGVQGMGLGLSVVYAVMQRHGGTARVESALGAGTTVWLRFAVDRSPAEVEAVLANRPVGAWDVLVVDRQPARRRMLKRLLEAAGQRVHETDGETGELGRLLKGPVDVVCVRGDALQHGGTGFLESVRTRWPRVRVVVLAGKEEQQWVDGLPRMVDRVLWRPVEIGTLLECLGELMVRRTGADAEVT